MSIITRMSASKHKATNRSWSSCSPKTGLIHCPAKDLLFLPHLLLRDPSKFFFSALPVQECPGCTTSTFSQVIKQESSSFCEPGAHLSCYSTRVSVCDIRNQNRQVVQAGKTQFRCLEVSDSFVQSLIPGHSHLQ